MDYGTFAIGALSVAVVWLAFRASKAERRAEFAEFRAQSYLDSCTRGTCPTCGQSLKDEGDEDDADGNASYSE